MLKDGTEILAEPISQIVNSSLCSRLPEGGETAKLRSIFKKGKIQYQRYYRPVSLQLVKSKVIEKVVHN